MRDSSLRAVKQPVPVGSVESLGFEEGRECLPKASSIKYSSLSHSFFLYLLCLVRNLVREDRVSPSSRSSYLFDLLAGVLLLEELQVELLLLLLVKLLQVLLKDRERHTHTVSKPGWKHVACAVVKGASGRQVFTGHELELLIGIRPTGEWTDPPVKTNILKKEKKKNGPSKPEPPVHKLSPVVNKSF